LPTCFQTSTNGGMTPRANAESELSHVSRRIIDLANQAEGAILNADHEIAADLLVAIADAVFAVQVFAPEAELE
jgi:hypothetical protein